MRRFVALVLLSSTWLAAPVAHAQVAGEVGNPAAADQVNPQEAVAASEDIVVTGVRASQQASIQVKRNEAAIVDAISAEDIGKLPDVTIVDSLQRISGVQIQRSAGEGATVNIRGLPQVVTLLNGEQYLSPGNLASAQPNLADVPAQLMNAVVVYKSTDVRNAMSGISGTIDLRTRRPFDLKEGLTVAGTAEYQRGADTKHNDYLFNGLLNWRTDRVGIMASVVKSKARLGNNYAGTYGGVGASNNDWSGDNPTSPNWIAPNGYDTFNREVERDRLGFNVAAQIKFGDGFTLSGDVFHTELTEYTRSVGLNISNRWAGLGWTNPTDFNDTGLTGKGQPWLNVREYDLDVWRLNSYSVNRALKSRSTNYNLALDYDDEERFKFSARALKSDAKLTVSNADAYADLSNWVPGPGHTFALNPRGVFYPSNIASQYPSSRLANGVVGDQGGRYLQPNPLGYAEDPQLHLNMRNFNHVWSGFDTPIAGGLGAGKTTRDYMANLDSYTIGSFSSEFNNRNETDLGVFRADGSYKFDEGGLLGFIGRLDAGVRRSDRSVQVYTYSLFSRFYGGNGASDPAGCLVQWKAIDVAMGDIRCRAGENVSNPTFDPAQPVSASNPQTIFQGYTVQRPTKITDFNKAIFVNKFGGQSSGLPGVWAIDPRDFDDARAFQKRVFGNVQEVTVPANSYDVDLVEESAYLNTGLNFWIVTGEAGVKVIRTRLTVRQNLTSEAVGAYGNTVLDVGDIVSRRTYTDVLPAINLSANVTDRFKLRAAFSKTMIPLDLNNYGGAFQLNTSSSAGPTPQNPNAAPEGVRQVTSASASGDPNLDPWRANNYDAAAEYYFGRASLLNVGIFKLDIQSFIGSRTDQIGGYPDADGVVRRTIPFSRPVQQRGGTLKGIEAGVKLAASDFIASGGLLRNLGLDANWTFSDSSQQSLGLDGRKLPFQDNSKHNVNLVGWYQDERFQARIAYNYRTPRLSGLIGNISRSGETPQRYIPVFQDSTGYVDVNLTYNATENLSFYVNGSNVFGEIEKYYYEFNKKNRQFQASNEFEPRYSAGLRFRF